MQTVLALAVAFLGGSGLWALLSKVYELRFKRKAEKEDKEDSTEKRLSGMEADIKEMRKCIEDTLPLITQKLTNVTAAEQEDLKLRLTCFCKEFIKAGYVDFDDYENLKKLHEAYEGLGGNGDIDDLMERVKRLPLLDSFERRKET